MKKIVSALVFVLVLITHSYATHNRAGEITFQHISGFSYRIIVTTYTKISSNQADRCELVVYFGDGDSATFQRSNGSTVNTDGDAPCPYYGQSLANDIKENVYSGTHTYSGAGTYVISMADPNRNSNICNIPNSVNVPFYIQSTLVINPFLGVDNSPTLLNPPIDNGCVGVCFKHNPGAYDVDGDSLAYSLVTCYANGTPIIGWTFPPGMTPDSINALTGTVSWCSPPVVCQYNIAILIKEYRRLPGSATRYFIGSILRDMQITINQCIQPTPPHIKKINDTCIAAGNNLNFEVSATNQNRSDRMWFNYSGGPFEIVPTATFLSTPSYSPVSGRFNWNPNCSQVQLLPYLVTFKASESIDTLTDFQAVRIRVVAPAPTGLTATPSGTNIILNWNDALCNDTLGNNPLTGYTVYRKLSCTPWVHDVCQTGVPSSSGYTQIGTTLPSVKTFTDNNNGQGLSYGINYSYLVVANYIDGSVSYASAPVCAKLVRDVPIITNVSVISTGSNDSIWVHWIPPLGDASDLDTIANPPIYEVRLMQAQGTNLSVFTMLTSYTYSSFSKMKDTGFVSTGLNTAAEAYSYRVDFYSNGSFVGSSNVASSVYLSSIPGYHQLTLSWQAKVPWTNYKYYIYKETSPTSSVFKLIDSTTAVTYTDTGLVTRFNYCYKVISVGEFSDSTIIHPLFNDSEIKCEAPVDTIAPCQPAITNITGDCETGVTTFTWLNPNISCAPPYGGDVLKYNIYFAPTDTGALRVIDGVSNVDSTTYTVRYLYEGKIPSVAGCYAVTAIDSSGNESVKVIKECVDNCPVYELPNVFTPNDDGFNDLYKALLPYSYIRDIDIKIYNRWGTKLFETKNLDVLWDGKNTTTKILCPDGVYYYVCIVNEIRLRGIVPHVLKGFIQLIGDGKN